MKEMQFGKWRISESGLVLHRCGKGFFEWYIYRESSIRTLIRSSSPYFVVGRKCECKLRRPPSDIRKIIRLIEFMEKMKNYGSD